MKVSNFDPEYLNDIINILDMPTSDRAKASLLRKYHNIFESYFNGNPKDVEILNKRYRDKKKYQADFERALEAFKYFDEKSLFHDSEFVYHCSEAELFERVERLNGLYTLIKSDESDINLGFYFLNNFPALSLERDYSYIRSIGKTDKKLVFAKEALENYDFIVDTIKKLQKNGTLDFVRYFKKNEGFYQILPYAKYVVNFYLNYKQVHCNWSYLDELGIYKEIFEYCLAAVKELDIDLYNKYLEKKPEKDAEELNLYIKTIHTLAEDIRNRENTDNPVAIEEFIERIPFNYSDYFYHTLTGFLSKYMNSSDNLTIISYVCENKININKLFLYSTEYNTYLNDLKVRGITVSASDKIAVIDYLKRNNKYLDYFTYYNTLTDYLMGNIKIDTKGIDDPSRVRKTLIPSTKNDR